MRILKYIILFFFLFSGIAFGATDRYVAPSGGATSGECPVETPCTFAYALTQAVATDTIKLNDGNYGLSSSITIPVDVNVTATNQTTPPSVRLYPTADVNDNNSPMFNLPSGSNTSQVISYIEFDGIDGSYEFWVGIKVSSRNNVQISHNYLHDFRDGTWWTGAIDVDAYAAFSSASTSWSNWWIKNPGEPGDDTALNALWPANPVTGLEIDNNTIENSGYWASAPESGTAAINLLHIQNSSIHDNTITNNGAYGYECISGHGRGSGAGKEAFLKNVLIYNNTLINTGGGKTSSIWSVEVWLTRECEIYNNTATAFFSITVGKGTKTYNNSVTFPTQKSEKNYGIEYTTQSYGLIEGNFIKNATYGVAVGHDTYTSNMDSYYPIVRNNVIYNSYRTQIWLQCLGSNSANENAAAYNLFAYNNTMDGGNSTYRGVLVDETDSVSTCIVDGVEVKNNIMTQHSAIAGQTLGTPLNVVVHTNDWYGNTSDTWTGSSGTTFTGNILTTPALYNPGDSTYLTMLTNYALVSPTSTCIDTGAVLTTANGAGTATDQLVVDKVYFIAGDYIWVDTDTTDFLVEILSIVYSTKTLTLASAKTWNDGALVYLAQSSTVGIIGGGIDIGAVEFNLYYSNALPQGTGIATSTGLSGTKPTGQTDTDWHFKAGSTPCTFDAGDIVASGDIQSVSNALLGGELATETNYCWDVVVNPDTDNVQSGPYYFTTTTGPPQVAGTSGKNLYSPYGRKVLSHPSGWRKR